MNEALRELMKDEIQEELPKAKKRGRDEATLKSIKGLMQSLSLDAKAAMEMLDISEADQSRYMTLL